MSITVTTPLNDIKEKLDEWYNKYLYDSEKSGNTPTESQVKKKLDEKAAELLDEKFSSGNYTAEMEQSVRNSIRNYVEVNCMQKYKDSLYFYEREENGKEPFEVSEALEESTKDVINLISKQIKNKYDALLREIALSGNVPNQNQVRTVLDARADQLISENLAGVDETTKQYVRNKVGLTVDACVNKYPDTIKSSNLIINNKLPWDVDTTKDEALKNADRFNYDRIKDVYESFSGCDMVCSISITLPGEIVPIGNIVVGYLQTLTYSIHQDKVPVRNIANMNPKDFTYGPRTIAGSLVFALFNKHWMYDMMEIYRKKENIDVSNHFLVDEMPPFDITITAANEYGRKARMAIYGVRLMNEGMVLSINDLYTENTYQYVATNIDYFSDTTDLKLSASVNKKLNTNVDELAIQTREQEEINNTEVGSEEEIQEIVIPNEANLFYGLTTKEEAVKKAQEEKEKLLAINKANKEKGVPNGTYTMQQYAEMENKIRTTFDAYINEYIPRSGKLE